MHYLRYLRSSRGGAHLLIAVLAGLILLGGAGYYVYNQRHDASATSASASEDNNINPAADVDASAADQETTDGTAN